ncbi:hypothetical protein CFOL_v3_24915 [Cephalotus follicularis]|uniref:Uncharacterized protein n=1 Tax=Cephalotus follicularis TaxID=3775 RepID=A0A1Q3CMH9_CEPFO|nr:hypothetical protein CFOL_v3_24915 [Cephalotus follicularis]
MPCEAYGKSAFSAYMQQNYNKWMCSWRMRLERLVDVPQMSIECKGYAFPKVPEEVWEQMADIFMTDEFNRKSRRNARNRASEAYTLYTGGSFMGCLSLG